MMIALFILQVAVFSIFPLYFITLDGPLRKVSFYIYLALVLLVGGFFGNVYSLPIAEGINISGGNVCYGAFMMTAVLFVLIERDFFILRHLVRLVILVDTFNVMFSSLVAKSLTTENVVNPHDTAVALFDVSTPFIILGGVLIILELLFLLFSFELIKKLNLSTMVTAPLYIILFIAVLCSDGILFPFIAFGFSSEIITIVFGGIYGKVLMASAFSVPLVIFITFRYSAFVSFLEDNSFRWTLLFLTSNELVKEMSEKDYELKQANTVFKNSSEGLAIISDSGNLIRANNAFQDMLKLSSADMDTYNVNVRSLFQHNGWPLNLERVLLAKWRGEVMFGKKNKHQGLLSVTPVGSDIEDSKDTTPKKRTTKNRDYEKDSIKTYVFSLVNIDEQKNVQQRLNYLARHDQLTKLPNRRVLDELLVGMEAKPATLLVIDLDHFKVNVHQHRVD
jgi:PAS domain-containing protein